MYRQALIELLERYRARYPDEGAVVDRFQEFVTAQTKCFVRACRPGHVTASAWVTTPDASRAVLVHHRRLGRWLQPGGHTDGEPEVHRVALREAQEETGVWDLRLVVPAGGLVPLDLDVHAIPPHGDDPEHLHYDVRFWVHAEPGAAVRTSAESLDVRWVDVGELAALTDEESVLRLARKVRAE